MSEHYTDEALTCPVCDEPMSSLMRGVPRTTCSRRCSAILAGRHAQAGRTSRDRAEDAADLLSAGESPAVIAQRLGIKPRSVARALQRAGRNDLAGAFEAKAITGRSFGRNYRYSDDRRSA